MKKATSVRDTLVTTTARAMVVVLTLILGAQPGGIAYAATITVNTAVDEDKGAGGAGCSLREAIIAANTDAAYNGCPKGKSNDTITFAPNLPDIVLGNNLPDVTANITFLGPKSPADSDSRIVVDAGGVHRSGFRVMTANVSLIRMTFQNGFATGIDDQGGAISQIGSGTLSIDSSTFLNNGTSGNGGAIFLASTPSLAITSSTFTDNTSTGDGGAIYVASSLSGIKITDSVLTNNTAMNGGAIAVAGALLGTVTISGTDVFSNQAAARGGVLWNVNPGTNFTLNVIRDTVFNDNYGGDGGVLYISEGFVKKMTIADSDAEQNSADDAGGVYFVDRVGTISVKGSEFEANHSQGGGGVFFVNILTGGITVSNSSFVLNASNPGGVLYVGDASAAKTIQITRSTFANNQVYGGDGGVLYVVGFQGSIKISGTEMNDNFAEGRGGVLFLPGANLKSLTITNSTFTGNGTGTGRGGVISLGVPGEAPGMASSVTISKSTFFNNIGGDTGGAIYLQKIGKLSITSTTFDTNVTANGGGAIHIGEMIRPGVITKSTFKGNVTTLNKGGGLLVDVASLNALSITKSSFGNNRAPLGGAIYANDTALKITGSYFKENRAGNSGGAVYATGSGTTLSITGSTFETNFTNGDGAGGAIASSGAFLTMSKTLFIGNFAESGSSVWFKAGEFHGNCFESNANVSVFDDVGGNDVTQNWWNDPGGPNQGAADNYLTAGTTNMYEPWLHSRPSCPSRRAP